MTKINIFFLNQQGTKNYQPIYKIKYSVFTDFLRTFPGLSNDVLRNFSGLSQNFHSQDMLRAFSGLSQNIDRTLEIGHDCLGLVFLENLTKLCHKY